MDTSNCMFLIYSHPLIFWLQTLVLMIQHGSFWAGNLGRLKDLTHQAWGTVDEQAPLEIVISDNFNNFPFSIAFLQGRFDVARAILQIVNAQ